MSGVREQFDKIMQERCRPEEMCAPIICHKSESKDERYDKFYTKKQFKLYSFMGRQRRGG